MNGKPVIAGRKMEHNMKDLGWENDWTPPNIIGQPRIDNTPQIVRDCKAAGHIATATNIGRCLTRCTCEQCGITYRVDSSD